MLLYDPLPPHTQTVLHCTVLYAGRNSDYVVVVDQEGEQEEIPVHRMLLEARSPFFRGMLGSNMAEAQQVWHCSSCRPAGTEAERTQGSCADM